MRHRRFVVTLCLSFAVALVFFGSRNLTSGASDSSDSGNGFEFSTPVHRTRISPQGRIELSVHDAAPLVVQTTAVRRGSHTLHDENTSVSVSTSGDFERVSHGVTERIVKNRDGVEQQWRFTTAPKGEGDLTVDVQVIASLITDIAGAGRRFNVGSAEYLYGDATWVDADGRRTPITSRWNGQSLQLSVPENVLLSSTYPAVLDPLITGAFPLEASRPTFAPSAQERGTMAFGGGKYLLVWHDSRRSEYDIFGARFDEQGKLLDPAGFPISTAPGTQFEATVAFAGGNFLVSWADSRADLFYGSESDVYAARVSPDGVVLDPDGIAVSTVTGGQARVHVGSDGTQFLIAWQDERNSPADLDVYGARIGTDGKVKDINGIKLSSRSGSQTSPQVVGSAGKFLVVYGSDGTGSNIYSTLVNGDGTVTSAMGTAIPATGGVWDLALAAGPNQYLVAWAEERGQVGVAPNIFATRLSGTGAVLDTNGFQVSGSPLEQVAPAVGYDGTSYLVAWQHTNRVDGGVDVLARRITTAGATEGLTFAISSAPNSQFAPTIASNSKGFLVSWTDDRTKFRSSDIYAARVTSSGTVSDSNGILVTGSGNAQHRPRVAFGNGIFLAVWHDLEGGEVDIRGARFDSKGTKLDAKSFVIAGGPGSQLRPAVAFNGSNFMVAYEDNQIGAGDIKVTRVSPEGMVLDPNGVVVANNMGDETVPVVAADQSQFLVAWRTGNDIDGDIYGARVSGAGKLLDTSPIAISAQVGTREEWPSVSFGGGNFLVAWEQTNPSGIMAKRISQAGALVDTMPVIISDKEGTQASASIGFSGTDFFVAWNDSRNIDSKADIYVARVTTAGVVRDKDGILVSGAPKDQLVPTVIKTGSDMLVVWNDFSSDQGQGDLFGARVGFDGKLLEKPFAVAAQPITERTPGLAATPEGLAMIVYSAFDTNPQVQVFRARGRFIGPLDGGVPEIDAGTSEGTGGSGETGGGTATGGSGETGTGGGNDSTEVIGVCGCTSSPWLIPLAALALVLRRRRS